MALQKLLVAWLIALSLGPFMAALVWCFVDSVERSFARWIERARLGEWP